MESTLFVLSKLTFSENLRYLNLALPVGVVSQKRSFSSTCFVLSGQSINSGKFKHLKYSENVNFEGKNSVDSILTFCAISSLSYRLIFPEMRDHFCLHEPASSLLNTLRTKWATTFCTYVAIRRELRECRPSNLAGLQNGIRDIGSSRYCVRCWTTSLPPAKPPMRSKLRMRTRIGQWSMSP